MTSAVGTSLSVSSRLLVATGFLVAAGLRVSARLAGWSSDGISRDTGIPCLLPSFPFSEGGGMHACGLGGTRKGLVLVDHAAGTSEQACAVGGCVSSQEDSRHRSFEVEKSARGGEAISHVDAARVDIEGAMELRSRGWSVICSGSGQGGHTTRVRRERCVPVFMAGQVTLWISRMCCLIDPQQPCRRAGARRGRHAKSIPLLWSIARRSSSRAWRMSVN